MDNTLKILLAGVITVMVGSCTGQPENDSPDKYTWKTFRGANVKANISEQDIADFKATGANVVRLSFPTEPFAEPDSPFTLRDTAFMHLERVLDICEKHQMGVIIDPHRFPGCMHQWTMLSNDPFWHDKKYQDKAVEIWEKIARRTAKRGAVVAGLDLLNEPAFRDGFEAGTLADINLFYERLIEAIRKYDTLHTIILAAPRHMPAINPTATLGYVEGLPLLTIPDDDNLAVEVHMYKPQGFTHQGIWEEQDSLSPYPGTYEGVSWDINTIDTYMKDAYDWSVKNDIPMFVGEFSCPRWTGDMGNQYIHDCIKVFEKYNMSWAYHAWRENEVWDAEMPKDSRTDQTRSANQDRLVLLKSYFKQNAQ